MNLSLESFQKMKTERSNPLLAAMRACNSVDEIIEFAELASTTKNYLYILASQSRQPKVTTAFAIERASRKMHEKTGGRVPVVTAQEMATMYEDRP